MLNQVIEICSSVLFILATATIAMLFIWLFCTIVKKCVEVFVRKK